VRSARLKSARNVTGKLANEVVARRSSAIGRRQKNMSSTCKTIRILLQPRCFAMTKIV